jgi:hypothetical protein
LAWAKQEGITGAVKTKEQPVMKVIDRYVQETGNVPDGYTAEDTLGITIRQPGTKPVAVVPEQLSEAA